MLDIITLWQCLLPVNLSHDDAAFVQDHHGHVSHERASNDVEHLPLDR